ncbi:hypothetical protein CsSME_00011462 [Camellia sinensis var. sinensis]
MVFVLDVWTPNGCKATTGSTMDLQEDTATWTFIIDGSWWA